MVLDLAGSAITGLPLGLTLWLLLLLGVRLLRHHLAGTTHVLLEVCGHGDERVGSVTILHTGVPTWILAQACDPAVPLVQRGRVAQWGGCIDGSGKLRRAGLYMGSPQREGRKGGSRTLLLTRGGKPWEGLQAA